MLASYEKKTDSFAETECLFKLAVKFHKPTVCLFQADKSSGKSLNQ